MVLLPPSSFARALIEEHGFPLALPHVTVVEPSLDLLINNEFFRRLVKEGVFDRRRIAKDGSEPPESHWLRIVPRHLRGNEKDIVNYLGMVVAIDFRHWGDQGGSTGSEVCGFHDFYCSPLESTLEAGDAELAENRSAVQIEGKTLLRGSAAMMFLLRRAAESGVLWYDLDYLATLKSSEEALQALAPCFLGCTVDGVTSLLMPATKERVQLLLSVSEALRQRKTTFYGMYLRCSGRLFSSHSDGFIDQLVLLHERYQDTAEITFPHSSTPAVGHVLKLSQLTALAIIDALHAFQHYNHEDPSSTMSGPSSIFCDEDRLSVCCDYQIPKALRACGILSYDSHLNDAVARRVLLPVGGTEEAAIRVGTLVACEALLQFVNEHQTSISTALHIDQNETFTAFKSPDLDYALWLAGRYCRDTPHHLCRTIMY